MSESERPPVDPLREAAQAVLEMHPDDNCPAHQALRAALASPAAPRPEGLDVRRVKQAVTNIAIRHGVTKDPPPPDWSVGRLFGYSRTIPEMDAEIAAEYDRLGDTES